MLCSFHMWTTAPCCLSLLQGPWARPHEETREGPRGAKYSPSQRNTDHAGWLQQGPGGPQRQDFRSTNTVSHRNVWLGLSCCSFGLFQSHCCLFFRLCRCFLLWNTLCNNVIYLPSYFAYTSVRVSRLEGTEEKLRNRESRPEDLHLIAELREMVTEREALVKKLVVSKLGGTGVGGEIVGYFVS